MVEWDNFMSKTNHVLVNLDLLLLVVVVVVALIYDCESFID